MSNYFFFVKNQTLTTQALNFDLLFRMFALDPSRIEPDNGNAKSSNKWLNCAFLHKTDQGANYEK